MIAPPVCFLRTRRGDYQSPACRNAAVSDPHSLYDRKMLLKPTRKPNRLQSFNYSADGVYFITICTKDRKQILSRIAPAPDAFTLPVLHLTEIGRIVDLAINTISTHYPDASVDRYVIMPNHIHLLLRVETHGRLIIAPTTASRALVSTVIQQCKRYVTKTVGTAIWQKGFYDHIIRDEADYRIRAQYIENNPIKWTDDKYYSPQI